MNDKDKILIQVWENLLNVAESRGLTPYALSQEMGSSPQYFSAIKNGGKVAGFDMIIRAANALGVKIDINLFILSHD